MKITTPKHRFVLWIVANLSLVAAVPAAMIYFSRKLNAGPFRVDGVDSIEQPEFVLAMLVLTLLLPLNALCRFLLRRYPGNVSLMSSTRGLKLDFRIIAGLCLAFTALCLAAAAAAIFGADHSPEFAILFLWWCYVTLAMRAAFVASARTKNDTPLDSAA